MATANPTATSAPGSWARSYPPLLLVVLAFLVAITVLPSALNLPQSNPSTVLEYAPVPPEDDSPAPPEGNVSSLGLGSSGTLTESVRPPDPPPPPGGDDFEGRGDRPKQFQCQGHEEPNGDIIVRQTFDPMSPECQPFYPQDADNGGVTYQGVTADEINVVLYADSGAYAGEQSPSAGNYIDIDAPAKPTCPETWPSGNPNRDKCDNALIRAARALSRHFNARWQTYNRHIHYWIFFSSSSSEAARRSDAVKIWKERKPFAVIDMATFNGFNEAFMDSLAARGVLVFTSEAALRGEFFAKNAPYAWGFWPAVPNWAEQYASYVCQTLAPVNGQPRTVKWSGNPQGNRQNGFNDQPRKFGLWYTRSPGEPGVRRFAELVKEKISECGIAEEDRVEATYEHSGFAVDNDDPGTDQAQAVATFKTQGVTTILWLGAIESKFTAEAEAADYYPEIFHAGDLDLDGNGPGRLQSQTVWQNAFVTSFQLRQDEEAKRPGALAARDGDPDIDDNAAFFANDMYRDSFMVFTSIQVAGPRLTPEQVQKGMHAIQKRRSGNPYKAAFFFEHDEDFSWVKDSMVTWWDTDSRPPASNQPGCYKLIRGHNPDAEGGGFGHRVLPWEWDDPVAGLAEEPFQNQEAPCTAFSGSTRIRP